jgi:hypothetical protein
MLYLPFMLKENLPIFEKLCFIPINNGRFQRRLNILHPEKVQLGACVQGSNP